MKHNLVNLFRSFVLFTLILYQRRFLIMEMAKRDISTRYVGSFLGFFWAFINPMLTISTLWFVFSVGLRVMPSGDVPFVVFLTAGLSKRVLEVGCGARFDCQDAGATGTMPGDGSRAGSGCNKEGRNF